MPRVLRGIVPRPTMIPVAAPSRRCMVTSESDRALSSPTSEAMHHNFRSDLSRVRALVLRYASQAGLPEDRANDLVLAVSEVAANTLRHTRSAGTLTIWHDADEVVCEIR